MRGVFRAIGLRITLFAILAWQLCVAPVWVCAADTSETYEQTDAAERQGSCLPAAGCEAVTRCDAMVVMCVIADGAARSCGPEEPPAPKTEPQPGDEDSLGSCRLVPPPCCPARCERLGKSPARETEPKPRPVAPSAFPLAELFDSETGASPLGRSVDHVPPPDGEVIRTAVMLM
ncbi:MAG: hypothetical protein GY778_02105 [bacterium]|nr:hypothetical protein [bacterium]